MIHELLCNWLDLPPLPWPPNHYALLGLEPGQGSMDEIELRVLERMEKLRRYQLLHPDQATEGMNLLAQAMICLTDPESRLKYDRDRGLVARDAPAKPQRTKDQTKTSREQTKKTPQTSARTTNPVDIAPLELEPLPDEKSPPVEIQYREGLLLPDEIAFSERTDPELLSLPEDDEDYFEEFAETPLQELNQNVTEIDEPVRVSPRVRRRRLYQDLVRIRRITKIWERLRTYIDDPEQTFARRTETLDCITCLRELRQLLPTVSDLVGSPGQPGNLIAVICRQQLVAETIRSLIPSQRDALAQDCRNAQYLLLDRYNEVRAEVKRLTAKGFRRRVWAPMIRHIILYPEWLFLIMGITALVLAFVRSLPNG